jgi:hypothetical protein
MVNMSEHHLGTGKPTGRRGGCSAWCAGLEAHEAEECWCLHSAEPGCRPMCRLWLLSVSAKQAWLSPVNTEECHTCRALLVRHG